MPEPVKPPEPAPAPDTPPAQAPEIVSRDAMLKEAAGLLENEPDPAKPVTEPVADPAAKPPKKAAPKAKTEPKEPEPEPESDKDPTPEPEKSKREQFMEKADDESKYRAKETKLKERESAVQKVEDMFREFEVDPIAYLEKRNPKAYEEWTERNLAAGTTPQNKETSALEAKVEALEKQLTGNTETAKETAKVDGYRRDLNEAEGLLEDPAYDAVRESAALHEEFSGVPSNLRVALAEVWIEYKQKYEKELTPQQTCEILLEDAQAHVARVPKSQRLKALFGTAEPPAEPTPPKKTPPTGQTLTQQQETSSAPAEETDYSQITNKEDRIRAIALGELQFEEEPE